MIDSVITRPRNPPAAETQPSLPVISDEPIIKIRSARAWKSVGLGELWAHRDLLYFLIWRDLKARYKQTILGISWVVLQPVLMTLVFTVFLGKLVSVNTAPVPYPVFAYSGLLPWIFFSNAVTSGSYSLLANSSMITKVFFPRLMIPAAAVGVRLVDFLVGSLVLVALLIYYGLDLSWSKLLILPLLVVQLTLLAFALSALLSALNVKYRDTGTALPVLLQLWMFVSPIVYPATYVPRSWMWMYEMNPLAGIVHGFRACLLGLPFSPRSQIASAVITILVLLCSTMVFRRMEDEFADIV